MTSTALNDFLGKLKSDTGLREELRVLAGGRSGLPAAEMVSFAATKGYRFTVEDVSGELSDRALEEVAGGVLPGDALFGEALMEDSPTYLAKKPGKKS